MSKIEKKIQKNATHKGSFLPSLFPLCIREHGIDQKWREHSAERSSEQGTFGRSLVISHSIGGNIINGYQTNDRDSFFHLRKLSQMQLKMF